MKDKFVKREYCEYCGHKMEPKYSSKRFCSDKCRTYAGREKKSGVVKIKDLTKPTNVVKPITDPPEKTNVSINTIPPAPERFAGEGAIEFAGRKNEWKLKYGQH